MMNDKIFDIAVIGGGVNGVGIARDAIGRGLSVVLLEKNDFASATSSASSKLIHGGLRYLEYYEFGLVRAALKEREILLSMAPHIIWPLEFILPHSKDMRPAWLIRLGLFLYDNLGGRKILPKSKSIKLDAGKLKPAYRKGFSYADCWVDDSRLVVLNALDAQERGAYLYNYTPCKAISCKDGIWHVEAGGAHEGYNFRARKLVNAAGPWVRDLLDSNQLSTDETNNVRLVKGSHIIVKRLFDGDESYILQQPDGRIVFINPYEDEYSVIGTTDVEYQGDPLAAQIDQAEIDYLCEAANLYLQNEISPDDVISSYSGVRPLLDSGEENASAVTRDYVFDYSERFGAPLISIFGGKLTTYRVLAEKAMDYLTNAPAWTKGSQLPGASSPKEDIDLLLGQFKSKFPEIDADDAQRIANRWSRQYGSRAEEIIGQQSLGQYFGSDLYQAEIDYLIEHEFVHTAEDVLWRRTKLGLRFNVEQTASLEEYIKEAREKQRAA
jgi:glycerol-3-phosphate dehydrogenase